MSSRRVATAGSCNVDRRERTRRSRDQRVHRNPVTFVTPTVRWLGLVASSIPRRSQLLIYHFMFGPDFTAGCPSWSMTADGFNGPRGPPRRGALGGLTGAAREVAGVQTANGLELLALPLRVRQALTQVVGVVGATTTGREISRRMVTERTLSESSSLRRCEGTCRPDRPRGHGFVPRPGHTEGLSGVRCAIHLGLSGEGRGRHSSPFHVRHDRSWHQSDTNVSSVCGRATSRLASC
jgi:hypothetical protein